MSGNLPIAPAFIDKHGPAYTQRSVYGGVQKSILIGDYFASRGKRMSKDIQKATDQVNKATSELDAALDKFFQLEDRFAERSKVASSRIRDASTKMADGLARVEKAASLSALERHCTMLSNMADSMERLAALQENGSLEKIAAALLKR